MNPVQTNPRICQICQKEFTSVSVKNRHLRNIHNVYVDNCTPMNRTQHIKCPNESRETFSSYNNLNEHLTNIHNINIKQSALNFRSREEFEVWLETENKKADYVKARTFKMVRGIDSIHKCLIRPIHRNICGNACGPW